MSIAGIASSTLMHYAGQYTQSNRTKWQQGLQQLGQDLQAGNLSAAQSDFAALQQLTPQLNSASSTQSGNAVAQDFTQLGNDLQTGNTSAAQQDYQHLQQDVSSTASGAHGHHHHHRGSNSAGGEFSQLLQQLGQALSAGNLTAAQQAYATLQQQFEALGQGGTAQSSESGGVTVSA